MAAQSVIDSSAAIRGDFPVDTDTQLSQAQVNAFETDPVAAQSVIDSAAAIRGDFPVDTDTQLSQAQVNAFETDPVAAQSVIDSAAAIRSDFPLAISDSIASIKNGQVPNYDVLRATDGGLLPGVIVVNDFAYTFKNVEYNTIGGVFYKGATGSENGGTQIKATDGTTWYRIWDGNNVFSEWWVVGGYDLFGQTYIDVNSTQGIKNEAERINSAIRVGQSLNLIANKVYIIDSGIENPGGNLNLIGTNAVWQRGGADSSLLTSNLNIGSNQAVVANPDQFEVGERVLFIDTDTPNGGRFFDENSGVERVYLITSITGNTVTLSNTLTRAFDPGDIMVHSYDLFGSNVATGLFGTLTMEGLVIDGNRDGNELTYDWRFFHDFSPGDGVDLIVNNCTFQEGSTTMCFPNIGHFNNCTFKDMNGAPIHIGSTLETGIYFNNCEFKNCLEVDGINFKASHTEAIITFSVNVSPVFINSCEVLGGSEALFGGVDADDLGLIHVRNTYAENLTSLFSQTTSTSDVNHENIWLDGNYFKNCGDINIQGRGTREFSDNRYRITNNIFINTRLVCIGMTQTDVLDNWFYVDENDPAYTAWATATTGQEAFLYFSSIDQVRVHRNVISGPLVNSAFARNGILFNNAGAFRRVDNDGNPTDYGYAQRVEVDNNIIANFTSGITTHQDIGRAQNPDYQLVGWKYTNNTIFVTRDDIDPFNTYGMIVDPGVIATNNIIYKETTFGYGAIVKGINDALVPAKKDSLIGGIFLNNIIYCKPTSIALLLGSTSSTPTSYNMIVRNNLYQGIITDNSDGSNIDLNISIPGVLPNYTVPRVPSYQEWRENQDLY